MVVSLGPDADRLQAKFLDYLKQAKKTGAAAGLEQIKIAGETWYRVKPGDCVITFGFQGEYFVAGIGQGTVEGILARWNGEAPAWLKRAMEQTVVSRRTGIIYLNLKEIRDKLLPLTPSQKDPLAALKMLGLDNVNSLVSTTGLEDDGMINRVHLSLDGEPRGLLDMISDRPLAAKDLGPIPHDALLAMAVRVDLDRALEALIAVGKKAGAAGDADIGKSVEEFKGQYGVDLNRFLGSVGDAWCIYNSPAEGEMAFLGWTAVVPVRDRAALLEGWEKLYAAQKAKETKNKDAQGKKEADAPVAPNTPPDVRKCRFAGHEIYYWAGQPITPAVCITDREMVMTLNMPAMKAYLSRKEHRSLATLPSVKRALNDSNRPVALGYCDTPRLFNFLYPVFSLYAGMGASAAQKLGVDLDPTFWPSAPAIRRHLRPDITTVERTPQGLQLTCRYSLPTGGASGPLWLAGFYYAATIIAMSDPPVRIFPGQPAWPLTPLAAVHSRNESRNDSRAGLWYSRWPAAAGRQRWRRTPFVVEAGRERSRFANLLRGSGRAHHPMGRGGARSLRFRAARRACPLQLPTRGLVSAETNGHSGPCGGRAFPDDRSGPGRAANRSLPGSQCHPGGIHRRGLRPGDDGQLRDEGDLPARSRVSGDGVGRRRHPGQHAACTGCRPDYRGRPPRRDHRHRPLG